MNYRSKSDIGDRFFCPAGSPYRSVFGYTVVDGIRAVRLIDTYNQHDLIQSCKDDFNVAQLVERALRGDPLALSSNIYKVSYADLSVLPTNIHEAKKVRDSIPERFNSLPDKLKTAFGSVENFSKLTSDQVLKIISDTYSKASVPDPDPDSSK